MGDGIRRKLARCNMLQLQTILGLHMCYMAKSGAAGLTWLLTNSQFNVLCTQLGLLHSLDVTDEKHFAPVGGWSWLSVGDGWSSVGFGPISDWSGSSSKAMLN